MPFISCKNGELKVKLRWDGTHKRKKCALFTTFFLSEGNFFISVLNHCIVYSINLQDICTFMYQKKLLHTLLSLVFEIAKSLEWFLKWYGNKHTEVISIKIPLNRVFRSHYIDFRCILKVMTPDTMPIAVCCKKSAWINRNAS